MVMLIAGSAWGVGRGNTLIRAVSFLGPPFVDGGDPFSSRIGVGRSRPEEGDCCGGPGGFGNGCNKGDESFEEGEITGGRRSGKAEGSATCSLFATGAIFGGNRGPLTGARDGRTIRAVSRLASPDAAEACSGRGGRAMRTVSFFGSAMDEQQRQRKSHKRAGAVTRFRGGPAIFATRASRSRGCR